MVTNQPRIVEELNTALHRIMTERGAYLLGEDVADPYGGAFRATRGLSTAFPQRVLSTPISENGVFGVAAGLALSGETVIVEVMFGDFLALAFDQVLNFITKSVSMYGRHTPMRVVIRCPVGGGRGYGPTHSQSMQKHFIGIPHLALYELTPFHDPYSILAELTTRPEPSILFEDKVLYTQRRYLDHRAGEHFEFKYLDDAQAWVQASCPGQSGPLALLISTGGAAHRALRAAEELVAEDGLDVQVLVPSRLYPPDLEPVLPLLEHAEATWIVEEGTAGGTWGAEIASRLHIAAWDTLRQPIRLVHSADRVIPAAPHLERAVLLQPEGICDSVRAWRYAPLAGKSMAHVTSQPTLAGDASSAHATSKTAATAGASSLPVGAAAISVPKLNSNDTTYVIAEWLADDGAAVNADEAVVMVETSKTVEEITAEQSGTLHIWVPVGNECSPGETIAYLVGADAAQGTSVALAPEPEAAFPPTCVPSALLQDAIIPTHEIPAAFSLIRVRVDAALGHLRRLTLTTQVGLAELVVRAIANCREDFPMAFGSLSGPDKVHVPEEANIAVSDAHVVDATSATSPIIRNAERLSLPEIAGLLAAPPSGPTRKIGFSAPAGEANIALAVYHQADLLLVQEIIPPPLACIISLTGISREIALTETGEPHEQQTVSLGLTYDHRIINGREANAFLLHLKEMIEYPEWIENEGNSARRH